jgi:hypothetical protein
MVDVARFNEWRIIMKEQEVVDLFRDHEMLSWKVDKFRKEFYKSVQDIFFEALFSKRKELKYSFFDIPNIMEHVHIANVAFRDIALQPRGILYVKFTYFIHVLEEAPGVVRLLHLWRSVYSYMIEEGKPTGGAYEIVMETMRNYKTLILDNPTAGTLIMFTRQNVPLWRDAQFQTPLVWKSGDPRPGRNIHINLEEVGAKRPRFMQAKCETCLGSGQQVGFACGWCGVTLYCNQVCRVADKHHEQICGLI